MKEIIETLMEIESGQVGMIVFSSKNQNNVSSFNSDLVVPLASAAKLAVGFTVAKWVEKNRYQWDDIVENIRFNPDEDSKEIYPHFQGRETLPLQDAVEIMIACHDSILAYRIVQFCGGWDDVKSQIISYFKHIHITENPMDINNVGELNQILKLLSEIFQWYQTNPVLWTPIINGMVRQQGHPDGIPNHHLAHMTGGLPTAIIDIGIMGAFHQNPLLYVICGKDLPDRFQNQVADRKIEEAIELIYKEYINQDSQSIGR